MDAKELAWHVESLRERAKVDFATARVRFEAHDELATDLAWEGFPVERAREILREEWDAMVQLATDHAHEDQSAAVRRAFASLTANGVQAHERCGFDNSEGHELAAEAARDSGVPGYVFYHHQDAARLVPAPGTLYLRFGATTYESSTAAGKQAEDEVVGRAVVAALEAEGLEPTWDGRAQSAIELRDCRWFAMPFGAQG